MKRVTMRTAAGTQVELTPSFVLIETLGPDNADLVADWLQRHMHSFVTLHDKTLNVMRSQNLPEMAKHVQYYDNAASALRHITANLRRSIRFARLRREKGQTINAEPKPRTRNNRRKRTVRSASS